MLTEEEALSKATAVAALLGVSKKTSVLPSSSNATITTSNNGSGLLMFGINSSQTSRIHNNHSISSTAATATNHLYANRHPTIRTGGSCIQSTTTTRTSTESSSHHRSEEKGSADTNSRITDRHKKKDATVSFPFPPQPQPYQHTTVPALGSRGEHNIPRSHFITTTAAAHAPGVGTFPATTTTTGSIPARGQPSPLIHPQTLKGPQPLSKPVDWDIMASTQPQQAQPHQATHPAAAPAATPMLSITSIGFGIDSFCVGEDATEAALRAVQDAMERSSLRLHISSPAQNLFQIQVRLGVPARRHSDGSSSQQQQLQPMAVDVARLSTFLPSIIPVLPIQVTVGGLLVPVETTPGAPSTAICTAIACITLQTQAAVSSPILGGAPSPAAHVTAPQSQGNRIPSSPVGAGATTSYVPHSPLHGIAAEAAALPLPGAALKVAIPSNKHNNNHPLLQHLNHLATAAASSPPHHMVSSSSAKRSKPEAVQRSTSMEMLAMVSEKMIRTTRQQEQQQQQQAETLLKAAFTIGSGLATAALLGEPHGGSPTVTLDQAGSEAVAAALLQQSQGRLGVPIATAMGAAGSEASESSSSTPVMSDELDGDLRNSYNYKKLPPGTTTKNNQRLFVKHKYRDYSVERPNPGEDDWSTASVVEEGKRPMRLVPAAFPTKLHETLQQIEADGFGDIIGWLPHGRSFKIHKQKEFADVVLPRYFIMTKKSSFLRQLNLYSFNRFSAGPDQGSYYHEKFLRGMKFLCRRMSRQKVNGNRIRSAGNPDDEPSLALFPVCPPPGMMAMELVTAPSSRTTATHAPDHAPILSALAGIASVASSVPPHNRAAVETPLKHEPGMEETDTGYGSSEENYSTGNAATVEAVAYRTN